jgi:hypothetical protein
MYIFQFFDQLGSIVNVEVVIATLPKMRCRGAPLKPKEAWMGHPHWLERKKVGNPPIIVSHISNTRCGAPALV